MLKLYNYFRSSASFRVRIALNLKGLEYQEIPIHLVKNGGEQNSTTYQAINPQSLVPTLQDNEKIIPQSLAIIEYLEEVYPEPALLPKDPYQKALARSFSLIIAADTHPLNNLRVLNYFTEKLNVSEEQKKAWYQHWVAKGLSALEKQLALSPYTKDFSFGNSPSLVDIFIVPQMYNARRFACDVSPYPILRRIDDNCRQHSAFINAEPMEEKV